MLFNGVYFAISQFAMQCVDDTLAKCEDGLQCITKLLVLHLQLHYMSVVLWMCVKCIIQSVSYAYDMLPTFQMTLKSACLTYQLNTSLNSRNTKHT